MMHILKLQPKYFDLIASGEKIYEIRLNDEKRRQIEVGDVIEFKKEPNLSESLVCEVKDLAYFHSFAELAESVPLFKMGFPHQSLDEVIKIYRQFYSAEAEQKYGVVAIKVQNLREAYTRND